VNFKCRISLFEAVLAGSGLNKGDGASLPSGVRALDDPIRRRSVLGLSEWGGTVGAVPPRSSAPCVALTNKHGGNLPTVRDDRPRENHDGPDDRSPLLTLRALVLLLISTGTGVLVYMLTGSVGTGFAVAIPLLLALDRLVK
jgi:hypothetical protein